jgi:hypothetical protein
MTQQATEPSQEDECPFCGGAVYRIPRRTLDRLLSHFVLVHRYHCGAMICGWQGAMRAKRPPQPPLDNTAWSGKPPQ